MTLMRRTSTSEEQQSLGLICSVRLDSDSSKPLVIMVHGRAGNKDVTSAFLRSFPEDTSTIAPQAPMADPIGGYSWWLVEPGQKVDPSVVIEAAIKLEAFISNVLKTFNLNPRKLFALGFSQGAALLSAIVQRGIIDFSGVALLSGFVVPLKVEHQKHIPIFMFHGTEDQTLPLELAKRGCAHLESAGLKVEWHTEAVGHKVGVHGMRALKHWFHSLIS